MKNLTITKTVNGAHVQNMTVEVTAQFDDTSCIVSSESFQVRLQNATDILSFREISDLYFTVTIASGVSALKASCDSTLREKGRAITLIELIQKIVLNSKGAGGRVFTDKEIVSVFGDYASYPVTFLSTRKGTQNRAIERRESPLQSIDDVKRLVDSLKPKADEPKAEKPKNKRIRK